MNHLAASVKYNLPLGYHYTVYNYMINMDLGGKSELYDSIMLFKPFQLAINTNLKIQQRHKMSSVNIF